MKNLGLVGLVILLTSGCASIPSSYDSCDSIVMNKVGTCIEKAEVVKIPTYQELTDLPPAETMPIVAVYGFLDKTGQRKRMDGVASFSTAVTQGAEAFLIDALKTAGKGNKDYGVIMDRFFVKTTSITQITKTDNMVNMSFENLQTNAISEQSINFPISVNE